MEILPPKKIKIVDIQGKGRGVVATEDIIKGEIIETCPIIFISDREVEMIEKNPDVLKYYYLWQYSINKHCIMLGYGSIYNHSKENPNADVDYNTKDPESYLVFEAIKDIKAGEEITMDYEFDDNKEEFLKIDWLKNDKD
jgi:hypothetical protein